jgi:hypothetical protein
MIEEWQPIKDFPGYEISSLGNVRTWRNRGNFKNDLSDTSKGLRPWISNGYKMVTLTKPGSRKHFAIHRLVAIHFIGDVPEKHVVCHKNDNKLDNSVQNLYYGTYSQNGKDAVRNKKLRSGEDHPDAKLSNSDVDTIRHLVVSLGKTHREVADIFGIASSTVSGIINSGRRK